MKWRPSGAPASSILLANGTVQGAVATWRLREQLLTSPPGRYRSLYRTIRQQNRPRGQAHGHDCPRGRGRAARAVQRPITVTCASTLDWLCAKSSAETVSVYCPETRPEGTRKRPTFAFSFSDQTSWTGCAPYIFATIRIASRSAFTRTNSSSPARTVCDCATKL